MRASQFSGAWRLAGCLWIGAAWLASAQDKAAPQSAVGLVVREIEGRVEVSRANSPAWDPAYTNQVLLVNDQLRTGERSRAVVQLANQTTMRVGELSRFQVAPAEGRSGFSLFRGVLYFFHRDKPGDFQLRTPTASAVIRGTEFNLAVAEDDTTTLTLFDGAVEMSNALGTLTLTNGQTGIAESGKVLARSPMIDAANVVQWCLYYPGILAVSEVGLTAAEQTALADSLAAYREGDLLRALARYPTGRTPASDPEKVYLAALLLSVGQVGRAEVLLAPLPSDTRLASLAEALRLLIAVTKQSSSSITHHAARRALATEWLAESYWFQAQGRLAEARSASRKATEALPNFAFAWARVAELEFSFGRVHEAAEALATSLELAPRNAEAHALQGFLHAAQNHHADAIHSFDTAITLDGALGNAWLGRGLCRIRQGHDTAGREDLQVAATLEPRRAILRSYLAKAFNQTGDRAHATREIQLAQQIDPRDPTAWLYSALMEQQDNRLNDAIRDLERSQALNENRRLYRSRLLLDQDRAVRGANLAAIYQDAGFTDVSVREAARAVNADYASYSAHLFLADSFNALRDPRQFNLRYETPWLSEYLVANLLAPVNAGALSPKITQQEYSKLFERDRVGFASATEYLSRGDWNQSASQFGTFGRSSYALDFNYRSERGQRVNNDLDQQTVSLKLKQELTPADSFYFQSIYYNATAGDAAQYYNPASAHTRLRVKETQEPILLAGYHHEWTPGSHTLFLAGRLQDTLRVMDPEQAVALLSKDALGQVDFVPSSSLSGVLPFPPRTALNYRSELEAYSAELQHLWQTERQTVIVGTRFQTGSFRTQSELGDSTPVPLTDGVIDTSDPLINYFPSSAALATNVTSNFQRISAYGYYHWQIAEPLLLTAGMSYDRLYYPLNFRNAPIVDAHDTVDQLSPKAGLIWTPTRFTALRAAYSRSLGGVRFDQSFRLEPVQVAGFNQAFRSLIPESVAGVVSAEAIETWGFAWDQKFASGTYLGAQVELLNTAADRTVGVIDNSAFFLTFNVPASAQQHLKYYEKNLMLTFNQLVGRDWSFGARYRLSDADLAVRQAGLPALVSSRYQSDLVATLHQVDLFARFYHPSGFFGQLDALWTRQSNRGYATDIPGDDFWQLNAQAGYRFFRRQAELRVGVLNLTDQDYRLNPLNLTTELPRQRTAAVSLKFSF